LGGETRGGAERKLGWSSARKGLRRMGHEKFRGGGLFAGEKRGGGLLGPERPPDGEGGGVFVGKKKNYGP